MRAHVHSLRRSEPRSRKKNLGNLVTPRSCGGSSLNCFHCLKFVQNPDISFALACVLLWYWRPSFALNLIKLLWICFRSMSRSYRLIVFRLTAPGNRLVPCRHKLDSYRSCLEISTTKGHLFQATCIIKIPQKKSWAYRSGTRGSSPWYHLRQITRAPQRLHMSSEVGFWKG